MVLRLDANFVSFIILSLNKNLWDLSTPCSSMPHCRRGRSYVILWTRHSL